MRRGSRDACRPTPEQELLLRAALLGRDAARDAAGRWLARVDLDGLDAGSVRLLPLLYRNLVRHGIAEPRLQKLKGVYRLAWLKNQRLLHRGRGVVRAFAEAGIGALLLKGAALVALRPEYAGLRPMDDFDVLVAPRDVPAAVTELRRLGFTPQVRRPERFLLVEHSVAFDDGGACRVDLHAYVYPGPLQSDADEGLWSRRQLVAAPDGPIGIPCSTDLLLHVCVHGAEWSEVPTVRWMADAAALLESGPPVDWALLLLEAGRRHLVVPLREALEHLVRTLQAPVPPEVLRELAGRRVSGFERLAYRVQARAPWFLVGRVARRWLRYRLWRRSPQAARRRFGFLRYLQYGWDCEHLWQLPAQILRRGGRRFWADLLRLGPGRPAER